MEGLIPLALFPAAHSSNFLIKNCAPGPVRVQASPGVVLRRFALEPVDEMLSSSPGRGVLK